MTVHETNCVVKFSTWPTTGTTITNEGSGGSAYNATAADNDYLVLASGATSFKTTDTTDKITIPHGAAINNLAAITVEMGFRFDGQGAQGYPILYDKKQIAAGNLVTGTIYYLDIANGQLVFNRTEDATHYRAWNTPTGVIKAGNWYDVQVSWDMSTHSNTPLVYINGVSQTMSYGHIDGTTWQDDSANDLTLGNRGVDNANDMKWTLTMFRLHNTNLSGAYLLDNYAADRARWKEANCQIKYTTWPDPATTITNEGVAGTGYNATGTGLDYHALPSGKTSVIVHDAADKISIPAGAAYTDPTLVTIEWAGYIVGVGQNNNGRFYEKRCADGEFALDFPDNSNKVRIYRFCAASAPNHHDDWTQGTASIVLGNWYHIAVTWALGAGPGATPILYINGQSVAVTRTNTGTGTWRSDSGLTAGVSCSTANNTVTADAYVTTFRWHNTILAPPEVSDSYNADKTRWEIANVNVAGVTATSESCTAVVPKVGVNVLAPTPSDESFTAVIPKVSVSLVAPTPADENCTAVVPLVGVVALAPTPADENCTANVALTGVTIAGVTATAESCTAHTATVNVGTAPPTATSESFTGVVPLISVVVPSLTASPVTCSAHVPNVSIDAVVAGVTASTVTCTANVPDLVIDIVVIAVAATAESFTANTALVDTGTYGATASATFTGVVPDVLIGVNVEGVTATTVVCTAGVPAIGNDVNVMAVTALATFTAEVPIVSVDAVLLGVAANATFTANTPTVIYDVLIAAVTAETNFTGHSGTIGVGTFGATAIASFTMGIAGVENVTTYAFEYDALVTYEDYIVHASELDAPEGVLFAGEQIPLVAYDDVGDTVASLQEDEIALATLYEYIESEAVYNEAATLSPDEAYNAGTIAHEAPTLRPAPVAETITLFTDEDTETA